MGFLPQKFGCVLGTFLGEVISAGCVTVLLALARRLMRSAMFSYLAMLQISICFEIENINLMIDYNSFKTRMSTKIDEELSYATHKKHTIKFKIVFIGDQSVGKSSIINRFIKNQFDTTHNPTVGIDFVSKNVNIDDKSVRLQLWDTAGQERFKSLIPGYLRDSHAIFLVFDVTNRESYSNVMTWLDYVKEHRGDDVLIFIVANKIDINEDRVVSLAQAQQGLKKTGGHIVEVSAKTGENLEYLFKQACHQLIKQTGVDTSMSKASINKQKKSNPTITGQKQRPIKSDNYESPKFKQFQANEKEMRGSKLQDLQKKNKGGRVVRQKNCC